MLLSLSSYEPSRSHGQPTLESALSGHCSYTKSGYTRSSWPTDVLLVEYAIVAAFEWIHYLCFINKAASRSAQNANH